MMEHVVWARPTTWGKPIELCAEPVDRSIRWIVRWEIGGSKCRQMFKTKGQAVKKINRLQAQYV